MSSYLLEKVEKTTDIHAFCVIYRNLPNYANPPKTGIAGSFLRDAAHPLPSKNNRVSGNP